MVSIIVFLLCLSHIVAGDAFRSFKRYPLPVKGSEAFAFDSDNIGPYTGLNDGRIVKYLGSKIGFVDFATTTQNRTKKRCDGTDGNDLRTCLICGRPLGLEFNKKTGELYVVDAYYGLMVVGKGGGVASQISGQRDGSDGTHFDFADGVDVDPITGDVYITDLGTIFSKTNNMSEILVSGDKSGRLLKYDPKTKTTTVLLSGLGMPAGLAVSRDGSFVLVGEYLNSRILRLWVKGPKANTSHVFVELPGNPDNIKRTETGDFWVAVNIQKLYPKLSCFPLGQKISESGRIVETVSFFNEYRDTYVTEVQERFGSLYVASIFTGFAGVYQGLRC